MYEALPFFEPKSWTKALASTSPGSGVFRIGPALSCRFPKERVTRDFRLTTDTWSTGDLSFTIYSPVRSIPDPARATDEELMEVLVPAVLAELTVDNRRGDETTAGLFRLRRQRSVQLHAHVGGRCGRHRRSRARAHHRPWRRATPACRRRCVSRMESAVTSPAAGKSFLRPGTGRRARRRRASRRGAHHSLCRLFLPRRNRHRRAWTLRTTTPAISMIWKRSRRTRSNASTILNVPAKRPTELLDVGRPFVR